MRPARLAAFTAAALPVLLGFGILTLWVPERWCTSLYQTGAYLLAALWLARWAVRPFRLVASPALAPLAGAALWGLAQLAGGTAAYRWETANAVLNWSACGALFFLALQAFSEEPAQRRFLNGLLYFGFALSVLSTVQMFSSEGRIFWLFPSGYSDLVLGPFVYRNQYAAFIETVLPIALWRAVREPERGWAHWAMAAAMVASVVAGASRAGTALVLAEVLAVVLLAWRRGDVAPRAAAGVLLRFALLAALATAVVGGDSLWQRIREADPYVVRREMLQSSLQMVRERPWTGFGLGTWATVYPRYALYDDGLFANQAHNDWAQWTVEGGLPLLALMLAFAAALVRPALRSLWGVGLLAVLLHCLVDYPLQQRPALAGWFFALAGALEAGRGHGRPDRAA